MRANHCCSRRGFLTGAAALGAAARVEGFSWPFFSKAKADFDENLTVLLSDLHVNGRKDRTKYFYTADHLSALVAEILRMAPLPRRCIIFGDIAFTMGEPVDYARSATDIRHLIDAGIEVTFGMGNHDHRKTFAAQWPEYAARTKVPGALVSVASAPDCDFLMLDSLNEKGADEKTYNPVYGALPRAEQEFLADALPKWPRPVFVCAHHPFEETCDKKFTELSVCGTPLRKFLLDVPRCAGYINGHDHRWQHTFEHVGYRDHVTLQHLTLPSAGLWGDIGYVLFRSQPGKAVAELHQSDFYFPTPLPPERCPVDWSAMVAANKGAVCNFAWR